jgi:hypothetical protein
MPIFILASGQRCGSTLVQRLLCSHPEITIWGEHNGILEGLAAGWRSFSDWEKRHSHHLDVYLREGHNNFIANMSPSPSHFVKATRDFAQELWASPALDMGSQIWGFKEVRYDRTIAEMLRLAMPDTMVIHVTRSITDCIKSLLHWERGGGWNNTDTQHFIDKWITINESFFDSEEDDFRWIFHTSLEELVNRPEATVRQLCEFLGVQQSDLDASVFDKKIFTDGYIGPDNRPVIQNDMIPEEYMVRIRSRRVERLHQRFGLPYHS